MARCRKFVHMARLLRYRLENLCALTAALCVIAFPLAANARTLTIEGLSVAPLKRTVDH